MPSLLPGPYSVGYTAAAGQARANDDAQLRQAYNDGWLRF